MNRKFLCEYDREKVNKKLMNSLRAEGFEEGEIKGEIKGKLEGKLEEKILTAKNMLKDKLSIDSISKYTGLSIKQINEIKI